MKKPWMERFGDFMAGKGFYIVLFLCVAAIGISGYYLFSSLGSDPAATVAGAAQVTVTPTPAPEHSAPVVVTPVKPTVPPAPSPTAAPSAEASAAPAATPKPTPVPTAAVYTWPVKGAIVGNYSPDTQLFSETMGDWRTHSGVDISAELGAQVKADAGGTVEAIEQDYFMGTTLTIDHGNGMKSVYSNLAELPTVKVGDSVITGAIIGAVGNTAKAESREAPHLHLEMTKDGVSVDPLEYLPKVQ